MELRKFLFAVVTAAVTSCQNQTANESNGPFAELESQGIAKYFGVAAPIEELYVDGVTTYLFDPSDGPVCLRNTPYRVAVRETGSEELFVFLQGGGACWSEFCFAIEEAPPGMFALDVLSPDLDSNPFRDWNIVYLPYCDGSLFAGDTEYDDNNDGQNDRFHAGLRNLSAALDLAVKHFPEPKRIVLAGSSGGGYGTIVATILTRLAYPGVDLFVINDSGLGLGKTEDKAFVRNLVSEFNAQRMIPESCESCLKNGHLTGLIEWQLKRDPQLKMAAFSYLEDRVIASIFLKIGGEQYKGAVLAEASRLAQLFPGRYVPFLIEGDGHTALVGSIEGILGQLSERTAAFAKQIELGSLDKSSLDGVTVGQWLQWMLDSDPRWKPLIQGQDGKKR